jgi:hypothetical protein
MKGIVRLAVRSALLAGLVLVLACPAFAARVAALSGHVEAGRGEPPTWGSLEAGDTLAPGDRVRTGEDGRAEIALARATIRLYPNSLLRLPGAAPDAARGSDEVELEDGTSLFDVLRGDRPFDVRTPDVVVSVKGTRFSVSLDGDLASVAVFHGTVGVRSLAMRAADEVLVREGFVASGSEHFDVRVLDLPDPWDGFSGDVLPLTPGPETGIPGDRRAGLDAARTAALAAARPEAVARAAERHPEVRERVDRLRGDGDRDGDAKVDAKRDPVADAPGKLSDEIAERYVETWLNNGDPSAGGGGSGGGFTLTVISGSGQSGGDRVLVEAAGAQSWLLDEDLVEDVVDGDDTLPSTLEVLLGTEGIDTQLFAQQVLGLLEGGDDD